MILPRVLQHQIRPFSSFLFVFFSKSFQPFTSFIFFKKTPEKKIYSINMYRTILEYIREIRITQTLLGQTFLSKKAGCFACTLPQKRWAVVICQVWKKFQWVEDGESRNACLIIPGWRVPYRRKQVYAHKHLIR